TLGPHTFYWFSLAERGVLPDTGRARPIPTIVSTDGWEEVIRGEMRDELAGVLSDYLHEQHWFRGRAHRILSAKVVEATPIPYGRKVAFLALIRVEYAERDPETYVLPLNLATGRTAETLKRRNRGAVIARIAHQAGSRNAEGLLFDAMWDEDFPAALLKIIASRKGLQGVAGRTTGIPTPALRQLKVPAKAAAAPRIVEGDLNNTSVVFGDRLILKLFRCVDDGINPDVEIGAFLSEQHFKHTPPLAGHIEYRGGRGRQATIAVLEQYIPHEGDGWDEAQEAVGAFLRRAARRTGTPPSVSLSTATLLDLASGDPDDAALDLMGDYLERARLLGKRTAELHLALSAGRDDAAFGPRPFTSYYQRSVYQAMRRLTGQTMFLLRRELDTLDDALAKHAQTIADMEEAVIKRFGAILKTRIEATRTRYHGDYRLSQVLRDGDDYVFVDFEGEPDRLMAERQLMHSPLRDVAGMIRSFHASAHVPLSRRRRNGSGAEQTERLEQWADYWAQHASAAFLGEYLRTAGEASFVPRTPRMLYVLLDTLLMERALTDLQLALVARPEGVRVPLLMLGHLLAEPDPGAK
ncbi:MAG TPA: putative maltokinase, partial [Chloroflexia bacterium]|nr:putative maltokinase [Chloroflexia bacterium]